MDIAALQLFRANLQRAQRAVHRFVTQPPGLGQPFAQPHDSAESVNHDKVFPLRARDQQAAIVGAKVDRGKGLAVERSLE